MSEPLRPVETPSNAAAAALEESCACGTLFLRGCADEARAFAERSAGDGQALLAKLADCKTPIDLLAAQYAWMWAQTEAAAETALRLWGAAIGSVSAAASDPKAFHLPD